MAIVAADIDFFLSGGSGNSSAAASLGGARSTSTEATSAIFDDVTSGESTAGDVEYRCVYVKNSHGSLSLTSAVAWLPANTPSSTTTVDIAVGTSAVNGTEQTVANESTAPTGVTWVAAATLGAGVALGDIPAGQHKAVWLRRTITAGTTAATDTFTLRATGDTAA